MRIKYQKVEEMVPHCGDCGEELRGNNSVLLPYKCSCGIWVQKMDSEVGFELVHKKDIGY